MDISAWFKNLALDTWYKFLGCLGATAFLISLLVETKGITNSQLQLLSLGGFLIGVGEWKNHSYRIDPNYHGKIAQILTRKPTFLGVLLDIFSNVRLGFCI